MYVWESVRHQCLLGLVDGARFVGSAAASHPSGGQSRVYALRQTVPCIRAWNGIRKHFAVHYPLLSRVFVCWLRVTTTSNSNSAHWMSTRIGALALAWVGLGDRLYRRVVLGRRSRGGKWDCHFFFRFVLPPIASHTLRRRRRPSLHSEQKSLVSPWLVRHTESFTPRLVGRKVDTNSAALNHHHPTTIRIFIIFGTIGCAWKGVCMCCLTHTAWFA